MHAGPEAKNGGKLDSIRVQRCRENLTGVSRLQEEIRMGSEKQY